MQLEYVKAKNESLTCTFNGIFLHSSYNPESESERFVKSLKIDFIPSNIIVIEPALSYCLKNLKERFPNSNIFAIRFIKNIKNAEPDYTFKKEFYFENESGLKTELFNYFGEGSLLNTFFVSWPGSKKYFLNRMKKHGL